jgi:hypothetical protein
MQFLADPFWWTQRKDLQLLFEVCDLGEKMWKCSAKNAAFLWFCHHFRGLERRIAAEQIPIFDWSKPFTTQSNLGLTTHFQLLQIPKSVDSKRLKINDYCFPKSLFLHKILVVLTPYPKIKVCVNSKIVAFSWFSHVFAMFSPFSPRFSQHFLHSPLIRNRSNAIRHSRRGAFSVTKANSSKGREASRALAPEATAFFSRPSTSTSQPVLGTQLYNDWI